MISPEQRQKAIKLYRNKSLTIDEIANLCDMSVPSCRKIFHQAFDIGVLKPRQSEKALKPVTAKFTDEQLEQIATDYYENKLTVFELEEKWGVHRMQLQRVRRRFVDKYAKKIMGGEFRVRPVQQFDLNGNLIAEFPNARQASLATNVNHSNLIQCCRGNLPSAGCFVWKYKEKDND